jgi:hypothetical protein
LESFVVREWLADGSDSKVVLDQQTSPDYQKASEQYPGCGSGACQLRVYVGNKACAVGASSVCDDWQYEDQDAKHITCRYGSYTAPIEECNVLANYYQRAAQVAGKPYADPRTGDPLDEPTGRPQAAQDSSPGTEPGSSPATGGQISPDGKDCLGNAVTLNPLTWVTGPVSCAMQWAFVPKPQTVTGLMTTLKTGAADTAAGQVVGYVGGWFSNLTGPTGCQGPGIDWDALPKILPGGIHAHPLDACPGSALAPFALFARLFLDVIVAFFGLIAVANNVAGVVGFKGLGTSSGGDE